MTLSSATARNSYACNGSTTVFPYTFKILDEAHIQVILQDEDGNETILTLTTHYTVSGVDAAGGGNVTTVATYAAGYTIVLLRNVPIEQTTNYIEHDAFPAESHEEALDKMMMVLQQQEEVLSRCLQVKRASGLSDADVELQPTGAQLIGFDATGEALALYDPAAAPVYTAYSVLYNDYANDLAAANSAIGAGNRTLIIDRDMTLDQDLTLGAGIYFLVMNGANITVTAGHTLTISTPDQVDAPMNRIVFAGAGLVVFTKAGKVSAMWAGALSDGSTDDAASIQKIADSLTAGGVLYVPKGSSYYAISTAIDIDVAHNVTIEAENGAEIRLTAADKDGISITKNFCRVRGLTMQGQGTYVTTGTSGKSLIKCSGTDVVIENCLLKEPEQQAIYVTGDRSIIQNNTIQGGKYFADAAAIGGDRQHYGILVQSCNEHLVQGNRIQPNSEATPGAVIEGILFSAIVMDSVIAENRIENPWDHSIYTVAEGCAISDNICIGGGIKVLMRATGTAVKGNTITGNYIHLDRLTSPLKSDNGIVALNPAWSTISNNVIRGAGDYGILLSVTDVSYSIIANSIIGNIIEGVRDSAGDDAVGIEIYSSQLFANNVIANNIIRDTGDGQIGLAAGISTKNLSVSANHTGNIFANNSIYDSHETGMYLRYLTGALIEGNHIQGVGVSAADAAMYGDDLQRSVIRGNVFWGDGSTMDYAYRESGSDYNVLEHNVFYNIVTTSVRVSGLGSNTVIRNNWLGNGYPELNPYNDYVAIATAGAETYGYANLAKKIIYRDPAGASRTDTTDTAANLAAYLLKANGAMHTVTIYNSADAAETITLAGGTGVVLLANDGAADLVINQNHVATLTFLRISATAVKCLVTFFDVP
jgi:hypothetical protein